MTDYFAYDHNLPCKNPNCKSKNRAHPNCRCYGSQQGARVAQANPGRSTAGTNAPSTLRDTGYAHGGSVCAQMLPHNIDCEYYAGGGDVQPLPEPLPPDNIPNTLGMVGAHQGLLGILRNVGRTKFSEPDNHVQKIHDIRLDPTKISEHTLSAGVGKKNLEPIMQRLAGPLQSEEPHPEALKSAVEYLNSSIKGKQRLDDHMGRLFEKPRAGDLLKEDQATREKLKEHLQSLREDPNQLLEVGGSLGHYLPEHGSGLAYQAAQATQYLNTLKPVTQQLAPLDTPEQVDKADQAKYDRQVDIAQDPLLLLQHMKDGTLMPQDLVTVQTIYPGLFQAMQQQATAQLIEAKTKDLEIPYRQKLALGDLLGQPLDFTQTPLAMQEILKSAAQPQAPNQPKGKSSDKATGVELKQINKVDEMAETPLEARQINKKSR